MFAVRRATAPDEHGSFSLLKGVSGSGSRADWKGEN